MPPLSSSQRAFSRGDDGVDRHARRDVDRAQHRGDVSCAPALATENHRQRDSGAHEHERGICRIETATSGRLLATNGTVDVTRPAGTTAGSLSPSTRGTTTQSFAIRSRSSSNCVRPE